MYLVWNNHSLITLEQGLPDPYMQSQQKILPIESEVAIDSIPFIYNG